MDKKIIITNKGALESKYGSSGVSKIFEKLRELVAADEERGIESIVCEVDNSQLMKSVGGRSVSSVGAQKSNKDAVGALCAEYEPAYVMLFGARDVIPHIKLLNPTAQYDPDPDVPSDLPYACDRPYSADKDPRDYIAPSRVVGRLPDITGGTSVKYVLGLLDTTINYKKSSQSEYQKFFGISADSWKHSTRESVRKAFGSSAGVYLSPHDGPVWSASDWKRKSHFINCHGDMEYPVFVGEETLTEDQRSDGVAPEMPDAHYSTQVSERALTGTVVAAECCYGAELYDPYLGPEIDIPISNAYLERGAHAYVGSTTISWGGSER